LARAWKPHWAEGATLQMELMIETPQSIFNQRGELHLLPLAEAAQGRCVGGISARTTTRPDAAITAAHQHMLHLACDFAKEAMQSSVRGHRIGFPMERRTFCPFLCITWKLALGHFFGRAD